MFTCGVWIRGNICVHFESSNPLSVDSCTGKGVVGVEQLFPQVFTLVGSIIRCSGKYHGDNRPVWEYDSASCQVLFSAESDDPRCCWLRYYETLCDKKLIKC